MISYGNTPNANGIEMDHTIVCDKFVWMSIMIKSAVAEGKWHILFSPKLFMRPP